MFKSLRNDIRVIKDRDPAAKNTLEVLLCYSGLHAIWAHRLATSSISISGSSRHASFPRFPASSRASRSIPAPKSAKACSSTMAWASSSEKRRSSATTCPSIRVSPSAGRVRKRANAIRPSATTSSSPAAPRSSGPSPSAKAQKSAPVPSSSKKCRRTRQSSASRAASSSRKASASRPATANATSTSTTTACPTPSKIRSSPCSIR